MLRHQEGPFPLVPKTTNINCKQKLNEFPNYTTYLKAISVMRYPYGLFQAMSWAEFRSYISMPGATPMVFPWDAEDQIPVLHTSVMGYPHGLQYNYHIKATTLHIIRNRPTSVPMTHEHSEKTHLNS